MNGKQSLKFKKIQLEYTSFNMDPLLKMYEMDIKYLYDDIAQLMKITDNLATFLVDQTEGTFEECPEIDGARNMIHEAVEIIRDYADTQQAWIENDTTYEKTDD